MDKKVYICSRIRQSRGTHLAQNIQRSPSNKSLKMYSPSNIRRSLSPKNSSIVSNNIFAAATADQKGKNAKLIAVQENVVKGQLLEQYIKTDEDLLKYQHSVLGGALIYKQDRVFGPKTTQERIYNQVCKSKVQKIMDGISQTFLFMGPEDGGKRHSFRGGENEEQGCVFKAAEELLNLMEITRQSNKRSNKHISITSPLNSTKNSQNQSYQLFVQIYCVHGNQVIDLLQKPQSSQSSKQSIQFEDPEDKQDSLLKLEIKQTMDFRSIYRHAVNVLLQLPQQYNNMSNVTQDSHLFVRFNVHRNRYVFSRGTFVKLGDFTSAKDTEYKVLGNFLTDISQKKPDRLLSNPHYTQTKLVNCLVDSLNRLEDNQCTIINGVSSHPVTLPFAVNSLQFTSKLKSKIDDFFSYRQESTTHNSKIGPTFDESTRNQMSPQEFEEEVEFVLKNIFGYTALTQNYSELEKQEWISIQQRRVFTLLQEVNIIFADSPPKIENTIQKLEEAKLFLKDIPLKSQNSRIYSPSQGRNLNNSISPNRSTRRIVTVQENNNDINNNIKRNIMDKIDQAIHDSKRQKNRSVSASNTDRQRTIGKSNFLEGEVKGLKGQLNNMEHNLIRKQQVISEYERDLQEKQFEIQKERELINMKETREEFHIQNEEELRLIISNLKIKLAKKKHDYNMLKEEHKQVLQDAEQEKLIALENQMNLQRDNQDFEQLYQQEKLRANEFESLLQKTRLDMENQLRHRLTLEENCSEQDRRVLDLQNMLHEEQDLNKDLRITNQLLDKKLEDLVIKNEELLNKNLKLKKKSEQEKTDILEQKNQELNQRRQKTKKLKKELKEIYTKLNQLVIAEKNLKNQNQSLERFLENTNQELQAKNQELGMVQDENQTLRNEIERMNQINRELEDIIKKEQEEVLKIQEERKLLIENLDNSEQQNSQLNAQLQVSQDENLNLNNEIKHLQDKCLAQNALIDKIEKQNEFLSNLQDKDIDKLDQKVQIITSELNSLRDQNNSLQQQKQDLTNELLQADKTIKKQDKKLKENQTLIQEQSVQINQLDSIMKEYIVEKSTEIKDLQSQTLYSVQNSASKTLFEQDEEDEEINNQELDQYQRKSQLRQIIRNSVEEEDSSDEEEFQEEYRQQQQSNRLSNQQQQQSINIA